MVMQASQVSVALASYNGQTYLADQLASIAKQTRLPDELVVCDDASKDGTISVIKAFAPGAPFRVRLVVNEQNLGSTKTFERAIKLCSGGIIALTDQDDVWRPDKLECLLSVLDLKPEVGAVFSDAQVVDRGLRPLSRRLWETVGFDEAARSKFRSGRALEVLLNRNIVTGATMAFRARFKELVLPLPDPPFWIHDNWIVFTIAAVAELAFVEAPLVLYRQHAGNQIGAKETSLRGYLAGARERDKGYLQFLIAQYGRAHKHLLELEAKGQPLKANSLSLSEEKIAHLRARVSMAGAVHHKLRAVAGEIVNRRYFRYSAGWRSAAKDLLH